MEQRISGNTATKTRKLLALLFMCFDHFGKMVFPSVPEMRIIGRIAFPLYCWCLVVGVEYTRSIPKYLLRMLITGIISQPLYMIALNHTLAEPNIFLTLVIALLGLWGMKEKKWGSQWWAPVLTLFLAALTNANYGFRGVLIVYLLYMVRNSRPGIAAVMIAYCLGWGATSSQVTSLFGLPLKWMTSGTLGTVVSPWLRLQSLAILALPLMLIRMPEKVKMPGWAGYVLYPAHLLVLYAVEQIF